MLERKVTEILKEWKKEEKKPCLLVRGARQVGKTFIIDDFAKKNYENYIYINFELSPEYKKIFDGNLDIKTLIMKLEVTFPDKNIIPYIDSNISLDKGIYVAQIVNYSPASKANLKVGDVIEKIDDVELNKMSDLRRYIYQKNPGDKVNLTIYRNKKEYNIEITLGKKS